MQSISYFDVVHILVHYTGETSPGLSFTLIRKYSQQLIINADKQGANKSREHITSISGRLSAFLLRNRTPFLRVDI